jgi:hypothetical protein
MQRNPMEYCVLLASSALVVWKCHYPAVRCLATAVPKALQTLRARPAQLVLSALAPLLPQPRAHQPKATTVLLAALPQRATSVLQGTSALAVLPTVHRARQRPDGTVL